MGMVVPPNRTTDQQKSAECGLDPSASFLRQTYGSVLKSRAILTPELKAGLATLSSVNDGDGLAKTSESLASIRLQPIGYKRTIEVCIRI